MKPTKMLLAILAVVAVIEAMVIVGLDALGFSRGIGGALLAVALSAAVAAFPVYMMAVRPTAELETEKHDLWRRCEVQDILIGIDQIAMQTNDPDPLLAKAAEDLAHALQVPRCIFWMFGSPDSIVEYRAAGLLPAVNHFPLRESPEVLEDALRTGTRMVVGDVRNAAACRHVADEMERFGARAFLAAPVSTPDGPIGLAFVCLPAPHSWSADCVRAVEAAACHVGMAVRHTSEVGDREDVISNLLLLLDHVPGLVYRGQRDWTMNIVSAGVERMTGYSPQEFLGGRISWKNLIHPDDLVTVKLAFRSAVAKTQRVLRVEYRARHRDGSYRWVADRRRLIYDDTGRFLYVDGLCLDITDRKIAESGRSGQAATAGVRA